MCGRYAASKSTDELVEELEIEADHTAEPVRSMLKRPQQPPAGDPDYNEMCIRDSGEPEDRGGHRHPMVRVAV